MSQTPKTIVIVYVRCAEGKRDELRAVLEASQAQSREEDGCLRYGFSEAVEEPGAFVAVEEWRDREALRVHLTQPHLQEFMASLPALVAGAPQILSHEVSGSGPLPF